MKIDIKSLIIGALSALCLVLLIGAKSTSSQQNAPVSQDSPVSQDVPKKFVTEITDLSGNKLRGTIVESSDTHIVLSIERTDKTVRIPRGGIQSIEEIEVIEMNNYDIPLKELKENGRYQVAISTLPGTLVDMIFQQIIDTRTGDIKRSVTYTPVYFTQISEWAKQREQELTNKHK